MIKNFIVSLQNLQNWKKKLFDKHFFVMEFNQFRCPRCGRIHNRKDGVKLSIAFKEKEEYNPVPSGVRVTTYYKGVYFCQRCDKQLRINRIVRYAVAILLPIIYLNRNSQQPLMSFLLSLLVVMVTLPLMVIVYRKIKMVTINKRYIKKAEAED